MFNALAIVFGALAAIMWLDLYRRERKWYWLLGSILFVGIVVMNTVILLGD